MPNIVGILRRENVRRGTRIAIVDGTTRVTYDELFDASARLAAILRACGMRTCDRVALVCEDGADYVALSLGILEAEGVLVPIPASASRNELEDAVALIDVRWIVTASASDGLAVKPIGQFDGPTGKRFLVHVRTTHNELPVEYQECGPAFVRFSSGTTGTSKGVLISHQAIIDRTDAADRRLHMTENDTVAWLLSMSFHFVVSILLFLRRGSRIVICGREFPAQLETALAKGEATFMYASPVHYALMVDSPAFEPTMFVNMRMAVSTAMPLSIALARRFHQKFGLHLSPAYGIIEVGLPCVAVPSEAVPEGSVGRPGPDYELKLLGVDGGRGEILVRGNGMFSAYLSPWKRREDLDSEGWFHTGDLGRVDGDGFVYVDGRKEEMINFAGMKIFAAEVEAVLNQHPCVSESLVYGVADPVYGQIPVARVVRRDAELDARTLRRFCYARLSSYKVPKRIEMVDRLDRTRSGKLRRTVR